MKGGSALIIKGKICHYEDNKLEAEDIQVMTVKIITKNGNITLAHVYSPPKHNIKCGRYEELNKFIIGYNSTMRSRFNGQTYILAYRSRTKLLT